MDMSPELLAISLKKNIPAFYRRKQIFQNVKVYILYFVYVSFMMGFLFCRTLYNQAITTYYFRYIRNICPASDRVSLLRFLRKK